MIKRCEQQICPKYVGSGIHVTHIDIHSFLLGIWKGFWHSRSENTKRQADCDRVYMLILAKTNICMTINKVSYLNTWVSCVRRTARRYLQPIRENVGSRNMADCSMCTFCATVITGFESVTVSECKQKLQCNPIRKRGKVFFDIPVEKIHKTKALRSVENLFLVVKELEDFKISETSEDKDDTLKRFYQLSSELDWEKSLSIWQEFTGYEGSLLNQESTQHVGDDDDDDDRANQQSSNNPKKPKIDTTKISTTPSFRVTASRSGAGHQFSSMEAAAKFGGGINDLFHWRVDLSNSDIEVLMYIVDNDVVVGLALTRKSLGKRNIQHFGPTTLKSSLAYNLLHLADIGPGDVVCDPMCGGGSIPIEGVLGWPLSAHLCGDFHDMAPPRTSANLTSVCKEENRSLPLDVFQWDVINLPLRTNSINAIITDMPFGKKSGSQQRNWTLYPKALREMARVCQPKTGHTVILTHDKKVMKKTLQQCSEWWKTKMTLWINMGGLHAGVYVLTRTEKCFDE